MGNCNKSQADSQEKSEKVPGKLEPKNGIAVLTFAGPNVFDFHNEDSMQPTFSDPSFFCQVSKSASMASISSSKMIPN